jgi:hypothetical protein
MFVKVTKLFFKYNYHTFGSGMSNTSQHNYKNIISKWLLAALLLLSFFTFGASSLQSSIKHDGKQTTLLVSSSKRFVKSISFDRALQRLYCKHPAISFLVAPALNLINLHSRQINMSLKKHTGPNLTRTQKGFFYQIKTTSPNAGDDPVLCLG